MTRTSRTSGSSGRRSGSSSSTSTTSTRPCPGPFEWDVKRLAASFAVAGPRPRLRREGARAAVVRRGRARLPRRDARVRRDGDPRRLVRAPRGRRRPRVAQRARKLPSRRGGSSTTSPRRARKDSLRAFDKLTEIVDGEPRIVGDPPLIVPIGSSPTTQERRRRSARSMHDVLRAYRRTLPHDRRLLLERYRYVDVARKVVGVGSVGTRAWIVLLLGPRRARPALPAGQGGRGVGARAVRRRERATATTASASSRASA